MKKRSNYSSLPAYKTWAHALVIKSVVFPNDYFHQCMTYMLVVCAVHTWISSNLSSFYLEPHMLHTVDRDAGCQDFFDDERCRLME